MDIEIPTYPRDAAKRRIEYFIARLPAKITFRGVEYTARVALPSFARKTQLAGVWGIADGLEIMLSLPENAAAPAPDRETLEYDGATYDIKDVQEMDGKDCYTLTVSKI